MKLKGGFTNYEQLIGVLMLDTQFPRPPGDIGNAASYRFPVLYKKVTGAVTTKIMGREPAPEMLAPFIEAAIQLEKEGVKGITTSCGFLAPFQKQLADAVSIPVFTSALIQVPLVRMMLGSSKPIGVFTERAEHLNARHTGGVGWSATESNVHIQGMPHDATFPRTYIGNQLELDTEVLDAEMVEMTRAFMSGCPDAGAIVLECTNMCPFSSSVARVSGLPVFDINTLINMYYSACRPVLFL
jgi:Asp/Glu/hydantoin racemase